MLIIVLPEGIINTFNNILLVLIVKKFKLFLLLCAEIVTTYIIAANLPVFFPSLMESNEYPLETKHILLNGNSDLKSVYLN